MLDTEASQKQSYVTYNDANECILLDRKQIQKLEPYFKPNFYGLTLQQQYPSLSSSMDNKAAIVFRCTVLMLIFNSNNWLILSNICNQISISLLWASLSHLHGSSPKWLSRARLGTQTDPPRFAYYTYQTFRFASVSADVWCERHCGPTSKRINFEICLKLASRHSPPLNTPLQFWLQTG